MQVKKTIKQFKRPRLTTERKRKSKKRAPSSSPTDIAGTLARLQEKHTIAHKELKEGKELDFDDFAPALQLLKGILFKADRPYRSRLSLLGTLETTALGVLNATFASTLLSSVTQWSSIDALFDQFFLHSIIFRYMPRNVMGGGWGSGNAANAVTTSPTGGSNASIENAALQIVALFGTAGGYTSASAMVNNPNLKLTHSSKSWTYVWRNNVRFDPHGIALGSAITTGWQGWSDIGAVADLGGLTQVRTINDLTLGTGSAILMLGDLFISFDVSFRARA
jgi:hypothetical protein